MLCEGLIPAGEECAAWCWLGQCLGTSNILLRKTYVKIQSG